MFISGVVKFSVSGCMSLSSFCVFDGWKEEPTAYTGKSKDTNCGIEKEIMLVYNYNKDLMKERRERERESNLPAIAKFSFQRMQIHLKGRGKMMMKKNLVPLPSQDIKTNHKKGEKLGLCRIYNALIELYIGNKEQSANIFRMSWRDLTINR